MAIVKYTNPHTGVVYAYESTARWNPDTKRNEPVRKYLGRVSDTGEIIATGGKRGRKAESTSTSELPTQAQYKNVVQSLEQMEIMLKEQQEHVRKLESENKHLRHVLDSIVKQASPYAG
ncbi:MAG: hypothetical protein IJS84_05820 [Spirochaetales bacterium]|nr:hypothetical protein [Spirochaetales bacterium]